LNYIREELEKNIPDSKQYYFFAASAEKELNEKWLAAIETELQ